MICVPHLNPDWSPCPSLQPFNLNPSPSQQPSKPGRRRRAPPCLRSAVRSGGGLVDPRVRRLTAGVSPFSLARRMGASADMIDRTYGHLAPHAESYERICLTRSPRKTGRWGSIGTGNA